MECAKEQLSDAYDTGYAYGCNDAGISDPDNRYINQPGKGPPFHTISFMNGYNYGFYLCTGNSEPGIPYGNNEDGVWFLRGDCPEGYHGQDDLIHTK